MAIRVFFLVVLIGLANSKLPYQRRCDPIESTESPTVCSNYRNIEFVYSVHRKLDRHVLDLEMYAENNNAMLQNLERTLNNALAELIRSTENQNATIQKLRNDVDKLERHQERVGGNFSDIEERLDITERQLMEKKAKLESLETKTEAAFNSTKTLLNTYKDELSHLNSMAQDLKVQLEGQLNVTKMELEEKLEAIEKNTEELTRSRNDHKVDITVLKNEVDKLEKHQERFGGNFSDIEDRLDVTEKQLMGKKAKLENLATETEAAFNSSNLLLSSYKKELSHLKSTAQDLEVKVEARLNVTKKDFEDKLESIQKNTEAFSDKLHNQNTELDHKITSRFNKATHELKTQNATMNHLIGQLAAKLENLETETEASFNNTKKLLKTHKNELSHLNRTAQGLEVQFESRLDATKTDLKKKLEMIQETTEAKIVTLEKETEASFNNTKMLVDSYKNQLYHLNSTTQDLRVNLESRLNVTKIELEDQLQTIQLKSEELTRSTNNHKVDITVLKNEVNKLEKHQERFGGNFSDIEERLDVTERQLMEKKAKLENLATETEASFNSSNLLLSSYKKELSHLKSTAQDLEVKLEARLNVTKKDFEDKLETIQKNTEVLSTELHREKSVFGSKIETLDKSINELKLENLTVTHRLNQIAVQKKVAFSATIIESSHSFTGPYSPGSSNILKFDRVFTNIGNAYNKKTGIFTAPVDGVYQFSFMTFGYSSHTSGAILVKNGYYQVSTWEFTGPDTSDTTSNSVILEMNAGDCVNIILWQGGKIHTSVFSGFLIFPLV